MGWASFPTGMNIKHLGVVGLLGGIGRAVQVDPMRATLKAPGTKGLKLNMIN
jgi:hypothetical protein